jgi:hypothetical protein
MILIRILFWFIVFYSLFKLLIRVVLPLLIKSTIRGKMKDSTQNPREFESNHNRSDYTSKTSAKKQTTKASNGDYIDFEEVK